MPSTLPTILFPAPTGGVRKDVLRREVPQGSLADAENWIYRRGAVQVRPGLLPFGSTTSQRCMGLTQYNVSAEQNRLVMGTTAGWWKWNSGTSLWNNITGNALSGGSSAHVIFRVFNKSGTDYLLGVNGVNVPKKWDNAAGAYSDFSVNPSSASQAIAVAFNRAIVLYGKTVDVSAYNDFDSGWGSVEYKLLFDTPGNGVGLMEIGKTSFAIYKEDCIYTAQPQAGVVPFTFNIVAAPIVGPVSPAAIVSLPDNTHAYLGRDGAVWIFNGMTPYSVGNAVREYIVSVADMTNLALAYGYYDPIYSLVVFHFPGVGVSDQDRAVAIRFPNYEVEPMRWTTARLSTSRVIIRSTITTWGTSSGITWAMRAGQTWGSLTRGQYRWIAGDTTGQTHELSGASDNGTAIPAMLETGLSGLGQFSGGAEIGKQYSGAGYGFDPAAFKTTPLGEHQFNAGGSQSVTAYVGASNFGEDRQLSSPITLTLSGYGKHETGHRLTARSMSVRIEASVTVPLQYYGSALYVKQVGRR